MKILGYGEDALCLWALRHRLITILNQLGDATDRQDAVVFYRPSFGRHGSRPVAAGEMADSAQFGEFDALIGTPRGVYLVEAKWSRSSGMETGTVVLRPEQVLRHSVFRSYLNAWRNCPPNADWLEFFSCSERAGKLEVENHFVPIAPPDSQLARSLKFILDKLCKCGTDIKDVLLYLQLIGGQKVTGVTPDRFQIVTIKCPSDNGFIDTEAARDDETQGLCL